MVVAVLGESVLGVVLGDQGSVFVGAVAVGVVLPALNAAAVLEYLFQTIVVVVEVLVLIGCAAQGFGFAGDAADFVPVQAVLVECCTEVVCTVAGQFTKGVVAVAGVQVAEAGAVEQAVFGGVVDTQVTGLGELVVLFLAKHA